MRIEDLEIAEKLNTKHVRLRTFKEAMSSTGDWSLYSYPTGKIAQPLDNDLITYAVNMQIDRIETKLRQLGVDL